MNGLPAMPDDCGATTLTAAPSPGGRAHEPKGALIWVFPVVLAPIPLDELPAEGLSLGRDPAASVQLGGAEVSRRHATLEREGTGGATIRDTGSRNGVKVNGRAVPAASLHLDDVVRLGSWIGVVARARGPFREHGPELWGGGTLGRALEPLARAAPADLPIVLEGETGTGKEVIARAIHRWSGRPGPLVAVNCAALPEALAEGELFGYRRGAFTGAERASAGLFRSADHGTLLLDEISDLPLSLQTKLLRVLEERAVQPLGEAHAIPIDVRVIAAGQQALGQAVRAGRFRADLLARLDGVTVELPPLRHRREDVLPLFSSFLRAAIAERAFTLAPDLAERLCLHDWPFNVRELRFLARRLATLHAEESTLTLAHLPARLQDAEPADRAQPSVVEPATSGSGGPTVAQLLSALRTSGGNVAKAAALLGITRQRAYRLMEGQDVDLTSLRARHDE